MIFNFVRTRILVVVVGLAATRAYPIAVGFIAFVLTVSMLLPFVPILIGAVAAGRERSALIVLLSSFGSATGGMILYLTFHHIGWGQITEAYPDLLQSKAWLDATRWVTQYGTVALFVVAASPLAQTPALALAAISELPIHEVFLALFLGKIIKYGFYAWLVVKFPSWFNHALSWRAYGNPSH